MTDPHPPPPSPRPEGECPICLGSRLVYWDRDCRTAADSWVAIPAPEGARGGAVPCPECRGGKSPSPAPPSPVDRAAMVAEAEGCEANYARFSNLDLRFRKDLGLRCAAHVKALAAECGRLEAEAGRLRAAAEERDKLIDYLVYPVPDADDPKEWAAGCGRAWRSVGFSQGYPDRARAVAAVRRAAGLDAADAPAAKEDR